MPAAAFRGLTTRDMFRQALTASLAWTPIESPWTLPGGLPGDSSRGGAPSWLGSLMSTASLTPAMTKIAKAISIWLETIAQTMTGTRMIRPSVMIFGILNWVASRLPA